MRITNEQLAEALEEGAGSDIWYDADTFGDEGEASRIEAAQDAMHEAAKRLRAMSPPPEPEPEDEVVKAFRKAAHDKHHSDGECEIDDGAEVSVSEDGGAYVKAWVWVYDDDADVCRECREQTIGGGEGFDGMCGDCADKAEGEA